MAKKSAKVTKKSKKVARKDVKKITGGKRSVLAVEPVPYFKRYET